MKLFCDCNSEWTPYQGDDLRFKFQSMECIPAEKREMCPNCHFVFWIEPHYENMIFDLRRMNEC